MCESALTRTSRTGRYQQKRDAGHAPTTAADSTNAWRVNSISLRPKHNSAFRANLYLPPYTMNNYIKPSTQNYFFLPK
jgi:hypothetical protein